MLEDRTTPQDESLQLRNEVSNFLDRLKPQGGANYLEFRVEHHDKGWTLSDAKTGRTYLSNASYVEVENRLLCLANALINVKPPVLV